MKKIIAIKEDTIYILLDDETVGVIPAHLLIEPEEEEYTENPTYTTDISFIQREWDAWERVTKLPMDIIEDEYPLFPFVKNLLHKRGC